MVPNAGARPATPAATPLVGAPGVVASELDRIAASSLRKINTENYPVALRLLPRGVRDDLRRAYAYARFVDDVGDEAAGDRRALLDAIDRDVLALPQGSATLAPVRDLQPLVRDHGLTVDPLRDLIEANRRDQQVARYETFDDLLGYCRLSAAPIGRIVLTLAGVDDPAALERSDQVCAALQVLEHCQDVGEDAANGRIYLPASDLRDAGVAGGDLLSRFTTPELRRVIARQVTRSVHLLEPGTALIRQLHGWARYAVLGYVAGGRATAAALKHAHYDVLAGHVGPSKVATLRYAALALSRRSS
jgi:squalene synthase HpnC